MIKKNIYCTITTLVDWPEKLREARELDLKEAAVFLTGIDDAQKKSFYEVLAVSGIESVPLVHLRNTTTPEEVKFFMERYNCRAFNVHLEDEFPLHYDLSEFRDKIFVENLGNGFEYLR